MLEHFEDVAGRVIDPFCEKDDLQVGLFGILIPTARSRYFFRSAVQFTTRVTGVVDFCAEDVFTRKRCASRAAS